MIMTLFLTFALASILAFFLACFRVHVCAVTSRACDEVGGCIWSLLAVSSGSIGAHPQSHPTRRRRRRGGGGRGGVAPLSKSRDPHLAGGKEEKQHTWFWIKEKQMIAGYFFIQFHVAISQDQLGPHMRAATDTTNRSILMTWHASLTTSCCDSSCGKSQVEFPWSDYKTRLDHASDSATSDSSVETSGATSETLHFLKNI